MEGFQWLRLGGIGALILAAVYVLLPTFVGESAESRLRSAAEGVQAPQAVQNQSSNDFELIVRSGDPAAIAAALEARYRAAGVAIDDVLVKDGAIEVLEAATTESAVAKSVAILGGELAVVAPEAFGSLPPQDPAPAGAPSQALTDGLRVAGVADAAYWGAVLSGLAGQPLPDGVAPGWTVSQSSPQGAGLQLTLEPAGSVSTPRVLLLDGMAVGAVFADGTAVPLQSGDRASASLRAASAGPLPGEVELREVEALVIEEAAGRSAADGDSGVKIPAWLEGILPDTRIVRGLDLQGGIDVTLQVELDQAVLGQAARDTLYLKDAGAKEGIIFESVRRAATQPILELTTDAPLSDVTDFMAERLQDYQYFETDARTHRFEMKNERQEQVKEQAVSQVLETLRKRLDETGTQEPSIVKKGGGRINVQLPGATDVQSAVDLFVRTAVLEFRMVNEEFDPAYLEEILKAAQAALPPNKFYNDAILNEWLWDTKRLDPDSIILWTDPGNENEWMGSRVYPRAVTKDGVELESSPYALKNNVPLTGNDVNDAQVSFDQQTGAARVILEFKPRGGTIFCDLTGEAVGKRFAIILDQVVHSAPSIRERICGGSASIEMSSAIDPLEESRQLATVLRTGALDASVVVASVRQVGATLGQDSIDQGSRGALVGGLIVLVFMALWYRTSGLIADVALVINVMLVLAALATFKATLTLPGIAGIALTVGMAVDANIIIYERIREELRLGVPPRKAVDVGFDKALVAVLDANITTAIAGVVLFSYGTGPIRGFAVTLLIGIATTLVSALFVTRTIMELVTRSSSTRLQI